MIPMDYSGHRNIYSDGKEERERWEGDGGREKGETERERERENEIGGKTKRYKELCYKNKCSVEK